MKWKHFPRYWPFVWGIHRSPLNSTHKGQCNVAFCVGNSPVTRDFPSQRPMTRSFDIFFNLRLNKRLSEQLWGWWFETPSRSSWRHYNDGQRCNLKSRMIQCSNHHLANAQVAQSWYFILILLNGIFCNYRILIHLMILCIRILTYECWWLWWMEKDIFSGSDLSS